MTKLKTIVLTASAIAVSTVAFTNVAHAQSKTSSFITNLDSNADEVITLDEYSAGLKASFNTSDTNSDGYLSEDERDAARAQRRNESAAKAFDAQDANGDGVLSRDEVTSERSKSRGDVRDAIKSKIDTDGDGEISDTEKDAAKAALQSRRSERANNASDNEGRNRADRSERAEGKTRSNRGERTKLDANDDDLISLTELETYIRAQFTRLDSNNDGVLTQDDRQNQKRGRRGGKN